MSMQWVRDYYGVPAKRGGRVEYTRCEGSKDAPKTGTITGVSGAHLRVRLDGEKHARPYHPTWQLRYIASPNEQDEALNDIAAENEAARDDEFNSPSEGDDE